MFEYSLYFSEIHGGLHWYISFNLVVFVMISVWISGSIIRSMRRLEELLRQMIQAAKNIGNTELENKFSESIKLLKRDIVFAASLYL